MRKFRPTHEVNGVPVVVIGLNAYTKEAFEAAGKRTYHVDREGWFDPESCENVFLRELPLPDEEKIALRFEETGRDDRGIDFLSQPVKSDEAGESGRIRMRVSFNGEVCFFLGPDCIGCTEKDVVRFLWRDGFVEA